jgi:hypothetical protein
MRALMVALRSNRLAFALMVAGAMRVQSRLAR